MDAEVWLNMGLTQRRWPHSPFLPTMRSPDSPAFFGAANIVAAKLG
jgi:hypothetical protein